MGKLLRHGMKILGLKQKIYDIENMKSSHGPVVYISNHQNNIDMFAAFALYPRKTITLGKKNIKYIPFFGQFFWLTGNFLVDRKNKAKAKSSMKKLNDRIKKEKINIWILPEGTRSRGRGLLPFKKGAFMTAIEIGVDIIPICFSSYGGDQIQLNSLRAGHVLTKVLPPFSTKGLTQDHLDAFKDNIYSQMKMTIAQLDNEVLSLKNSPS